MTTSSFIYELHHNTMCARPAVLDLQGKENYIAIVCDPQYNGVYKWTYDSTKKYETWRNGRLNCYCIPFSELTYVKSLDLISNERTKLKIYKMQKDWVTGKVKNHPAHKNQNPDWLIQLG